MNSLILSLPTLFDINKELLAASLTKFALMMFSGAQNAATL
jgi:hypothetical protein